MRRKGAHSWWLWLHSLTHSFVIYLFENIRKASISLVFYANLSIHIIIHANLS